MQPSPGAVLGRWPEVATRDLKLGELAKDSKTFCRRSEELTGKAMYVNLRAGKEANVQPPSPLTTALMAWSGIPAGRSRFCASHGSVSASSAELDCGSCRPGKPSAPSRATTRVPDICDYWELW